MLLKFFRQSYLHQFLVLFLIQVLLWGKYLFMPTGIDMNNSAHPLFNLISRLLGDYPLASTLFAFVLLAISAVLINIIMIRNELVHKNSLVPALLFIVLMSSSPRLLMLYPELPAIVFLLMAIDRVMLCYGESEIQVINNILSAGIYIALGSLFYLPSIWFLLIIWIALFTFRQLTFRLWFISLIGISLPLIYLLSYIYILGEPTGIYAEVLQYFTDIQPIIIDYPDPTYIIWGLISLAMVISILYAVIRLNEWNISNRRKVVSVLWLLITGIPLVIYSQDQFINNQAFQIIPITFFIAMHLSNIRVRRWQELIFSLFILLVLFNNYLY